MKKDQKKYDESMKSRASTKLSFRALASGYLIYISYNVIKTSGAADSSVPPWVGWLAAAIFCGCAIAFGIFAWKQYKKELENAQIREEAPEDALPEPEDEEAQDDGTP